MKIDITIRNADLRDVRLLRKSIDKLSEALDELEEEEQKTGFHSVYISDTYIEPRGRTALWQAGYGTLGDLAKLRQADIRALPGIGDKSAEQIFAVLEKDYSIHLPA